MGEFKEIKGNLITLAKEGQFEVIAHGCNCFNMQYAGIADQMRINFNTDKFRLESEEFKGDYNKLGQIDFEAVNRKTGQIITDFDTLLKEVEDPITNSLTVVNCYTQYNGGANLEYQALIMALMKINHTFKGRTVGIPLIGGGIAGGNPDIIKSIMQKLLKDVDATLVIFEK